ncbi:MAG: DNA polymerase IV [Chitinophagales bacterium]|nr:DNA polymerase IV [Chitinophagales bacterium]MDW8419113.1 DNA polymerase IV [Chitinophagales bacterium]
MQRYILHIDLDAFFVSVERLLNPALKDKPVIVGGSETRGVVSSCSYEARAYGVCSAMSIRQARRLCPVGVFLRGNIQAYIHYSNKVTDILAQHTPLFEKASIDEFYVDCTGMDKYFDLQTWATGLRQLIIAETGLPVTFGLSVNKMLAKMATDAAKPDGFLMVLPERIQEFLDPMPVGNIPFCGPKTQKLLHTKGIRTIHDLRQFSVDALRHWLGSAGEALWHRAHGKASDVIVPFRESKSMSCERTYHNDISDINTLNINIIKLIEKLAVELRAEGKVTACLTVKVRYSDYETRTCQTSIRHTAETDYLIKIALQLFEKLYKRHKPVRLLGVKFSQLADEKYINDLFSNTARKTNLYKAVDNIKHKYGDDKLTLARIV